MDTRAQLRGATTSDSSIIANVLANADDQGLCKPVQEALDEAGFDAWVESVCRPYCESSDNRSPISLGAYFRLNLLACLMENGRLRSSRVHEWRPNSTTAMLGARQMLPRDGTNLASAVCHLPLNIHRKVFAYAIGIMVSKGLLQRPTADSRSPGEKPGSVLSGMVHKETGEDWTGES